MLRLPLPHDQRRLQIRSGPERRHDERDEPDADEDRTGAAEQPGGAKAENFDDAAAVQQAATEIDVASADVNCSGFQRKASK